MSPKIVLITGANRGLGSGLLELYLVKPNHTVIAANRDPKHPTSTELLALPTAEGTTVKVVKLDATSPTDAEDAAQTLKVKERIDHIDILIPNAGIGFAFLKLEDARVDDIRAHFETNVIGNVIPPPNAAYAPTKLVQHWYTRTVAIQEPWLTAFPIDPGFVQTGLGNNAAEILGLEKADVTVEESARGVVGVIDISTRETHSGKLWKWTGQEEPW
ncbi:hypothetical protein BDW62DRAFT_218657 [Aspergillus aurantiobrunneus]